MKNMLKCLLVELLCIVVCFSACDENASIKDSANPTDLAWLQSVKLEEDVFAIEGIPWGHTKEETLEALGLTEEDLIYQTSESEYDTPAIGTRAIALEDRQDVTLSVFSFYDASYELYSLSFLLCFDSENGAKEYLEEYGEFMKKHFQEKLGVSEEKKYNEETPFRIQTEATEQRSFLDIRYHGKEHPYAIKDAEDGYYVKVTVYGRN